MIYQRVIRSDIASHWVVFKILAFELIEAFVHPLCVNSSSVVELPVTIRIIDTIELWIESDLFSVIQCLK